MVCLCLLTLRFFCIVSFYNSGVSMASAARDHIGGWVQGVSLGLRSLVLVNRFSGARFRFFSETNA